MALINFHDLCVELQLVVMIVVLGFALVTIRFNSFSSWRLENEVLETIWTLIPLLIIVGFAIPSFYSLYFLEDVYPSGGVNGTSHLVEGHQWYWDYYSLKHDFTPKAHYFCGDGSVTVTEGMEGEFCLSSHYTPVNADFFPYCLDVDVPLVVYRKVPREFVVTAADVIHSFALPSAGVKIDAIPGKLNTVRVKFEKPGIFFGQCSEICGANHTLMPIVVTAVDQVDPKLDLLLEQGFKVEKARTFFIEVDLDGKPLCNYGLPYLEGLEKAAASGRTGLNGE
jgi:cytochrome c oxidase subunit 2